MARKIYYQGVEVGRDDHHDHDPLILVITTTHIFFIISYSILFMRVVLSNIFHKLYRVVTGKISPDHHHFSPSIYVITFVQLNFLSSECQRLLFMYICVLFSPNPS